MTNTKEYIAMSGRISQARKGHELHALNVEITNSRFTAAEQESLQHKISAAFCALNAATIAADPNRHPHGRFTLLPRAVHLLVFSFFIFHFSL